MRRSIPRRVRTEPIDRVRASKREPSMVRLQEAKRERPSHVPVISGYLSCQCVVSNGRRLIWHVQILRGGLIMIDPRTRNERDRSYRADGPLQGSFPFDMNVPFYF